MEEKKRELNDLFETLFPELKICKKKNVYYICEEKGIDKFGQPDVWLFSGNEKEAETWMKGAVYVGKRREKEKGTARGPHR